MQAIDFKAEPHDGMIKRQPQFKLWDNRQMRVILLLAEIAPTIKAQYEKDCYDFDAVSLNIKGFRFNREEANER